MPHSWRRCRDAGLQVRIPLLRDRIHQGWILTALWVIDSGVDRGRAAAHPRRRAVCPG